MHAGSIGLSLPALSAATALERDKFLSFWTNFAPQSGAMQSFMQSEDHYSGLAVDAVYVIAQALNMTGGNASGLNEVMRLVSFQGVSGPISFDSNLDPLASDSLQVVAFDASTKQWARQKAWYRIGACFKCSITLGTLFAIAGREATYKDVAARSAVHVAILRIAKGQRLEMFDGTYLDPILHDVNITLLHGDTSAARAIPTGLKHLKKSVLESVIEDMVRDTVHAQSLVGFVGLGFSSEGLRSESVLSKSEKVVISHSATNPGLTDNPWFARTVPHDSVQGVVMAELLDAMDVDKNAPITIIVCPDG